MLTEFDKTFNRIALRTSAKPKQSRWPQAPAQQPENPTSQAFSILQPTYTNMNSGANVTVTAEQVPTLQGLTELVS